MNTIFTRRSVRRFLNKAVEPEKIEQILRAGMQAPSAKNQQPWDFLVVTGEENLLALSGLSQYSSCLKHAGAGIIVFGNTDRINMPEFFLQDLSAATQNIMLEAADLDLGTVWFGTYPVESNMNYIKKLYNLSENLIPFSVIAVGYPEDENANKFVDRYDPTRIKYVK